MEWRKRLDTLKPTAAPLLALPTAAPLLALSTAAPLLAAKENEIYLLAFKMGSPDNNLEFNFPLDGLQ